MPTTLRAEGEPRRHLPDDIDRKSFMTILGRVVATHKWKCHAFCSAAVQPTTQGLSPSGDSPFLNRRPGARFRTPGPRQFVYESTQSKVRVTAFFQSAYSLSRSAGSIWGCHSLSLPQLARRSSTSDQKPTARPAA